MAEQILPGVQIEVRAEALIVGGPVSVGNIGIVGTAERGPTNVAVELGSYAEAVATFGHYDPFEEPATANFPLTLVRALELAYSNGASTVFAVRVAGGAGVSAAPTPGDLAGNSTIFAVSAINPGPWGNDITMTIVDDPPDHAVVTFTAGDIVETYTVTSGNDLVTQVRRNSTLVSVTPAIGPGADPTDKPVPVTDVAFAGGNTGADASDTDYATGMTALLNRDAHIIVAAGQDIGVIGNELLSHVDQASGDEFKRDRIGIVGSAAKTPAQNNSAFITASLGPDGKPPTVGERIIYVMPGLKATDSAVKPAREVVLPGSYAAAAIAGMLSARSPHISLTNKAVSVGGLEVEFTSAELTRLVGANVLAIERRRGFRVVKGITTDTGAFQQITTRRIVDFAKFGVRAAAEPFIGLLNNDRVRQALNGSINGFLADMVTDEMIISYELDVSATRDDEIRGVARVTMTVRPTFSIDFIKVVMFLG